MLDHPPVAPSTTDRHVRWLPVLVVVLAVAVTPLLVPRASAQTDPAPDATTTGAADDPATDSTDDALLAAGAEVYTAVCSSCHQPGGVGLAGRFPPLLDNPNVTDAAYVATVIANGRTGELSVNGETYNGVMPAQSTLNDADTTAVIAYIQSGFAAPASAPVASTGPVAGTKLPALTNFTVLIAALVVAGAAALILGPRVIAANDARSITWVDAWMKTAVIVVGAIVVTTVVPAWLLERATVQDLPRTAQDLLAVAVWLAGIVATVWALWYARREHRV